MPYTKEELKDLPFYQNLLDEDEQNYLAERDRLKVLAAENGSDNYSGDLLVRDQSGTIKVFENPYTGELYQDQFSQLYHSLVVDQMKEIYGID